MIPDFGQYIKYGVEVAVIATLFFIVWRLFIWIMAFIKTITEQHNAERATWQGTLSKQSDLLLKIADTLDNHDKRADERGRFVREEHTKMIGILDDQTKALGRINGYK